MKGKIYCGVRTCEKRITGRFCPDHPGGTFRVKFPVKGKKPLRIPASSIEKAEQILNTLRHETGQGKFDDEDWRPDQPHSFVNVSERFLRDKLRKMKKGEIKKKTFDNLSRNVERAQRYFGHMNIKEIHYGHIDEWLDQDIFDHLGSKSKKHLRDDLHRLFNWARKKQVVKDFRLPEFPTIKVKTQPRRALPKEDQEAVLRQIYEMTYHINPKIFLGILWLATYTNVRPGELLRITEGDFDLRNGFVWIQDPKEGKGPKRVELLDEDVELVRSFPPALPHLRFFRHHPSVSHHAGRPFGEKYLYKWAMKALAKLGIEGVDLYGLTRHTSISEHRRTRTPEEARAASGHSTRSAFEHYNLMSADYKRELYAETRPDVWGGTKKKTATSTGTQTGRKILPLHDTPRNKPQR